MMIHRILIPLDGSHVSESALPYVEKPASLLSPQVKVEITLLQVLPPPGSSPPAGFPAPALSPDEKRGEQSKRRTLKYLYKTGETFRNKGIEVTPKATRGDPCEEIMRAGEEMDADLIVMCTHGLSGLSRWTFGSVTEGVLRREEGIPIVTIKPPK